MMELSKYIACICEGAAEQAVIELLLDSNKLIFRYDDMLENEVIRCGSAQKFEERYLRKGFTEKITILRILDSHRENFNLSRAYRGKIDVINIVTAPEIEMLMIYAEKKYAQYKRSGKKPSIFCKEDLGYSNVKSTAFVKQYFQNIDVLIAAIREHKRVAAAQRDEYTLADLLQE